MHIAIESCMIYGVSEHFYNLPKASDERKKINLKPPQLNTPTRKNKLPDQYGP